MIFNSVGSAFAGGAGQNTGGTSSQPDPASESESNADQTGSSAQAAAIPDEEAKAPIDEDALRTQALAVQKRMNTDLLIRSLGAAPDTGLGLPGDTGTETKTPVPLAALAYAENVNQSAAGPAKSAV